MLSTPRRGTTTERALARALVRLGLKCRMDLRPESTLRCKADFVFRRAHVCVFVDGCFWHGCVQHFSVPKRNRGWWSEKIADNRKRDRRQTRQLRQAGWVVIRVWEHELSAKRLASVAGGIASLVAKQQAIVKHRA